MSELMNDGACYKLQSRQHLLSRFFLWFSSSGRMASSSSAISSGIPSNSAFAEARRAVDRAEATAIVRLVRRPLWRWQVFSAPLAEGETVSDEIAHRRSLLVGAAQLRDTADIVEQAVFDHAESDEAVDVVLSFQELRAQASAILSLVRRLADLEGDTAPLGQWIQRLLLLEVAADGEL
jgi:hypothetical protein